MHFWPREEKVGFFSLNRCLCCQLFLNSSVTFGSHWDSADLKLFHQQTKVLYKQRVPEKLEAFISREWRKLGASISESGGIEMIFRVTLFEFRAQTFATLSKVCHSPHIKNFSSFMCVQSSWYCKKDPNKGCWSFLWTPRMSALKGSNFSKSSHYYCKNAFISPF